MKLNRKAITLSVSAVVCVAIFGYFYFSLSGELNRKSSEYKALGVQLKEARLKMRIIHKFEEAGLDSGFADKILSRTDLPSILDTFMKTGKGCGVSLPSITPREAQDIPGMGDVVKIPITIEAQSKCRNLGEFLSTLIRDLRAAMAQVERLEIKKTGSEKEAKLEAVIELSMYMRK